MTMIKGKPPTQPQEDNAPQFRENPEINAKIDAYIKANPKRWDYIQSLSQERMARTIVLQDVQKQERTERIRAGVLRKLDENPELKKRISDAGEKPAGGAAGKDDGESRHAHSAVRHSRSKRGASTSGPGDLIHSSSPRAKTPSWRRSEKSLRSPISETSRPVSQNAVAARKRPRRVKALTFELPNTREKRLSD